MSRAPLITRLDITKVSATEIIDIVQKTSRMRPSCSKTALRRVHELLVDVLDYIHSNLDSITESEIREHAEYLCAHARVMIRYYAERDVFDRNLANALENTLRSVGDLIKAGKRGDLIRALKNTRLLIDGLVAYLYRIAH